MIAISTKVLVAFLLGVVATFAVRTLARRLGIVAAPRPDRWHTKPTAMLGGVAIYFSFIAALLIAGGIPEKYLPIIYASTLLFMVGLIDDLFQLRPYVKLVFQLIASTLLLSFGLTLPWTQYDVLNQLITVFWFVGITNAINLLDNMDGLAGGISAIACLFLVLAFSLNGQPNGTMITASIMGALIGFLVFNFNPASIFMGDCGSMFLGSMLAGISLMSDYGRTRNLTAVLITPVLILLTPIFDTCLVTFARKFSGRSVAQGGRDHTSHRLVALGMSERKAVLMLYTFALLSGLLGLSIRYVGSEIALLLIPGFAITVLLLGFYLGEVRIYERGSELPVGRALRLAVDFGYKRRVLEVLLDAVLIILAYYAAYLFRWDAEIPSSQLAIFVSTLPFVLGMEIALFLVSGLYRGLWRYTGMNDLFTITRAIVLATSVTAFTVFWAHGFRGPSRGVFVLNAILLFLFVVGSRVSFRILRTTLLKFRTLESGSNPVLIYGAGDRGDLFVRETFNGSFSHYTIIGFIDDDERKVGKLLHGHKIFSSGDAERLIKSYGITEVIITSQTIPLERIALFRPLGIVIKRMNIALEPMGSDDFANTETFTGFKSRGVRAENS